MTSFEISFWLVGLAILAGVMALVLGVIIREDLEADSDPTEIPKPDDDPWKYGR